MAQRDLKKTKQQMIISTFFTQLALSLQRKEIKSLTPLSATQTNLVQIGK